MDKSITIGVISLVLAGAAVSILFLSEQQHNSFADKNSVQYSAVIREYTLVAKETTVEIAPGVRVVAWTYNGTIPGPTIRATEGDRVIIHFINESHLPHTIHLHGDHNEKNDGSFQEVLPGTSYTYDFIAGPSGALMYHCHVMPVTQHIRNGLYGTFIVDPQEKIEPAREYVIVKGEYDLDDQETWDPDYIFFNGYADQYWNNPLEAKTGELVRIYYIDMGALPAFGYHIHGTIFDAVPSGIWENDPLKVQTWEVSPGNAAIFEARWKEAGRYPFHIHGVPEEKGTMAYFDVSDAPPNAIDGKDIAIRKSIYMWQWQKDLLAKLQAEDAKTTMTQSPTPTTGEAESHVAHMLGIATKESSIIETTTCEIEKGAAMQSTNKSFYPQHVQAKAGDTVQWTNNDTSIHTVTGETFDSGMLKSGDQFVYKFENPGVYDYYCVLHPWMKGSVQVV